VSDARASRPNFDRSLDALEAGDTLVITPRGDALVREELCDRALHLALTLDVLLSSSRLRPAACWACCSSPTRAGPPGPTSKAG